MKRVAAIFLSLALSLSLLCPAWAAAASPVLRIENGALTLEGLGDQSINSVQLELTMSGTGTARFSAANSSEGSYGVGKTDGNKITIYIDSPQPLNQSGTAFLGTLDLDGNAVTQAKLTLLGRDLDPNAILNESSPIQVRQTSSGTPGGNPSGDSGSSGGDSDSTSTGAPTPKPDSGATADSSATPGAAISFTDVPANAYYADAVAWAVENGITTGATATTFSPDTSCTRAQIVTFLWRAAGSPGMSGVNPFADVAPSEYYYDAVLWAVENGITTGTAAATFSPGAACTRAQAVSFLYRAKNSPAVRGTNSFMDLAPGAYYTDAVQWAVNTGVTSGTTASTFSPDQDCTRAQIVTFLYRDRVD